MARGEELTYDPLKHHRRSIRLAEYDYAAPAAYFVTIVVQGRECLLGQVGPEGVIHLSEIGQLVQAEWLALPARFPRVTLDAYVVMPNTLGKLQEAGQYLRPGEHAGWLGQAYNPLTTVIEKRSLTDNPYWRDCSDEELTFAVRETDPGEVP